MSHSSALRCSLPGCTRAPSSTRRHSAALPPPRVACASTRRATPVTAGAGAAAQAALRSAARRTQRCPRPGRRSGGATVRASSEQAAADALERGKSTYASGDRVGACRIFEGALATPGLSRPLRVELAWSVACCHAAFGDVETSWQYLREALDLGLDYASVDTLPGFMRMEASAQLRKQLGKEAAAKAARQGAAREAREARAAARAEDRVQVGPARRSGDMDGLDLDISGDTDDSFAAVARRLLILIAVSVIGGAILFKAGLSAFQ